MNIYVVGSASPNPGKGGFGVVVINENNEIETCYAHYEDETTNNR